MCKHIPKGMSRSDFQKLKWASRSQEEKDAIFKKSTKGWKLLRKDKKRFAVVEAKRIKAIKSKACRRKMSISCKKWQVLESKEHKHKSYTKVSKSNSKPHYYSEESRNKVSMLMSATAKKVIDAGGKWGAGGWNKGIPMPEKTKKRISKGLRKTIAKGYRPNTIGRNGYRSFIVTRFGTIECHSSWEKVRVKFLDKLKSVVNIVKEPFRICYKLKGKYRSYYPDFKVEYSDGVVHIEEVKPIELISNFKVKAKSKAARKYCKDKGYKFRLITFDILKTFKHRLKSS